MLVYYLNRTNIRFFVAPKPTLLQEQFPEIKGDLHRPGYNWESLSGLQSCENGKPILKTKYTFNITQDTRMEMYREMTIMMTMTVIGYLSFPQL